MVVLGLDDEELALWIVLPVPETVPADTVPAVTVPALLLRVTDDEREAEVDTMLPDCVLLTTGVAELEVLLVVRAVVLLETPDDLLEMAEEFCLPTLLVLENPGLFLLPTVEARDP